jgi:D-3-phosphoglycerate dehydrogenase
MKHKVLLTDFAWPDLDIERSILAEYDGDPAVLKQLASEADAIMTNWVDVRAEVIDAAPKCRIISRLGIGLDCIDVAHATTRGIPVTNVPDYAQSGRYNLKAGFPLRRIAGQTLGIVGLGNTGRCVAQKALAFGLKMIATSRSRRNPMPGVEWADLDELLRKSDYVSLHIPLNANTRHIIGAAELAQMKQSAFLINTARGGLIDHRALAAALAAGTIAGAALDVQDPEPPDLSQPPWNDPRVIVTPHAAFYSSESVDELRRRASHQVGTRLAGGRPENVVNPEVL